MADKSKAGVSKAGKSGTANAKGRISSRAGDIKGSMKKSAPRKRTSPGLSERDLMKLTVKGTFFVAAAFALLMLLITGADFRFSSLSRGFRDKYSYMHASGQGFPVDILGTRTVKASRVTNGTALLTDTTFSVYDGRGREAVADSHSFSSPAMENAGVYSLLFDRMGKDYLVRTISGVVSKGRVEDSIICADISSSGGFVLVTNSETTDARVLAFSSADKTEPDHKWKSVDYKISDAAISPSGKYIALTGVSVKNGEITSTVIVQKIGAKENLREYEFPDMLIIDIEFDGNSVIEAIGDNMTAIMDFNKDVNTIYSYDDRVLKGYDIGADGSVALVLSNNTDGRNASVEVIDESCKKIAGFDTDMTSPYVALDNGRISLMSQSMVSTYNFKGKLLGQEEVPADCQEILYSQGTLLARGIMYLADAG